MWYGLAKGGSFAGLSAPNAPNPITLEWWRFFLNQNPQWDWHTLTREAYENYWTQSLEEFTAVIGTDNPDISAFRDRGGKLILWHGLADQLIYPQGTMDYYKRVQQQMGGADKTSAFAPPLPRPRCRTLRRRSRPSTRRPVRRVSALGRRQTATGNPASHKARSDRQTNPHQADVPVSVSSKIQRIGKHRRSVQFHMQHQLLIAVALVVCTSCSHVAPQPRGFRVYLANAQDKEHLTAVCEQDAPIATVFGNHRFGLSGPFQPSDGRPENLDQLVGQFRNFQRLGLNEHFMCMQKPGASYSDVLELLDGVCRTS